MIKKNYYYEEILGYACVVYE